MKNRKKGKRIIKKIKKSTSENSKKNEVLAENFVGIQKVLIELSLKLNDLSNNLSKLLKLFEMSAETLVKKDFNISDEDEEKILKKLDLMSEQNKLIAKGVALMHEKSIEETNRRVQSRNNPIPEEETLQQSVFNLPSLPTEPVNTPIKNQKEPTGQNLEVPSPNKS